MCFRSIVYYLFLLGVLCSSGAVVYSQKNINIKASVNNLFRYGNGSESFYGITNRKEYFENLTDTKISINNLTIGTRFEIREPAELGNSFKGIRKRYIEFSNHDNFEVRAGTFWEIIGRGLTLNCFEQRELAFDTGLDGIRIIYKNTLCSDKKIKVKSELFGGYLEYTDYIKPGRTEKYDIKDANLECTFFSHFDIGFNLVYANGKIHVGNTETSIKAYLPEVYLSFNSTKFMFFSSYAYKKTHIEANELFPVSFSSKGDGFYASLNYTVPKFGITFEYKNYRFDVTMPDNQSSERPTKSLPFQNPPAAVKQHIWVLTSRIPHAPDINDELGCQLDVFFAPNENLYLTYNASITSHHYNFYDSDTSSLIKFSAYKRKFDFLPAFDESYSPYFETSMEAEYDFSRNLSAKAGLYFQNNITYNYFFREISDKKQYITIPVEARLNLTATVSSKFRLENQWIRNSFGDIGLQNYTNHYASFSITKSPYLSVTFNAEHTTDKLELSGKNTWLAAEASYNITPSSIITASYGSERGGLKCTSGICRYINPFNGFRLTIQNIFK